MPVIIHDFELTIEPPQKPTETGGTAPHEPPASVRPDELARIERHWQERRRRVKAD